MYLREVWERKRGRGRDRGGLSEGMERGRGEMKGGTIIDDKEHTIRGVAIRLPCTDQPTGAAVSLPASPSPPLVGTYRPLHFVEGNFPIPVSIHTLYHPHQFSSRLAPTLEGGEQEKVEREREREREREKERKIGRGSLEIE